MMSAPQYETIKVTELHPTSAVHVIHLNRPSHLNALSTPFFAELPAAIASLDQNPQVNAIILAAAGAHFCSGIDLSALSSIASSVDSPDPARTSDRLRREIKRMQAAVTALEACRKPVIAGIHGACVGGGVDIVTACDVRYCSVDAFFAVKEVDLGITADLGTLQRLPGIVGFGNAMELALTGRRFSSSEAKEMGLVTKVFESKGELDEAVARIAEEIAAKSPLAVTGTKAVLVKSKDMSLDQGLDYVATWNAGMLLSDDLKEATSAFFQKRKPSFSKL